MKSTLLSMRRLFRYVGKDKPKLFVALALTLMQTASMALNPFLIGLVMTELYQNIQDIYAGVAGAAINFSYVFRVIVVIMLFSTVVQGAAFLSNFILTGVVQQTSRCLRADLAEKLNRLPMSFFDSHFQGDLLSRMTNDVDSISMAMQQSMLSLVMSVLSILFSVIMMFVISIKLGLIGLVIVPLSALMIMHWTRRSQQHFQKLQDDLGDMSSIVQETFTGFDVVKLYDKEEDYTQAFAEANGRLAAAGLRASMLSGFSNPTAGSLINIGYIAMSMIGAGMVLTNKLTVGSLQAATQYLWQVFSPISQIAQLMPPIQAAAASTVRVFSILDEKEERPETQTLVLPERVEGRVSFKDLRFGYTPDRMVIDGFSLDVEPGQTIAIVGPTGVGKTTIANLLQRFYEWESGSICIDGIDIQQMTRQQLRSLIGVVPQDPWLYHATIEENLRFGKLDATHEQIVEAANVSNVDSYIRRLENGYQTMLNSETSNISQGQKQLMTIARAILSDPPLLILDEATSSVDTRLELLIQRTMRQAMEGRTSFVIAHRLSTIREADVILVMRDGNIAEQGRHEELLAKNGYYADLYNSQFGGSLPE